MESQSKYSLRLCDDCQKPKGTLPNNHGCVVAVGVAVVGVVKVAVVGIVVDFAGVFVVVGVTNVVAFERFAFDTAVVVLEL